MCLRTLSLSLFVSARIYFPQDLVPFILFLLLSVKFMRWSIYTNPSDYQLEIDRLHVLAVSLISRLEAGTLLECRLDYLEQLFIFWFRHHYPYRPVAGLEPTGMVTAFLLWRGL